MGLMERVSELESKMLDLTYEIYNAMLIMDKQKVKVGLASLVILNGEYYDITRKQYIQKDYITKQYERLNNGCR